VRDAGITAAWLLPLGLLLLASVVVPLRVFETEGLPRYRALRKELHETREKNDRMRREVLQLREQVGRLQSDPEAIERLARDELGMLRNDEIVFQFPE
jgi:cell division protein FtsB